MGWSGVSLHSGRGKSEMHIHHPSHNGDEAVGPTSLKFRAQIRAGDKSGSSWHTDSISSHMTGVITILDY